MILSRARYYSSCLGSYRRTRRLRLQYRRSLAAAKSLSTTASTTYRNSSRPTPYQWVQEVDTLPFLPNTDLNPARQNSSFAESEDWLRLQELCGSGLRLLKSSLKGKWPTVEAAVYCRLINAREETNALQFVLVNNMDLLAGETQTFLNLDNSDTNLSTVGTEKYLLENEIMEIPSRSCVLLPLVKNNQLLGLFLLSFPPSPQSLTKSHGTHSIASVFQEESTVVHDAKTLLLSGLDQYQSSALVKQIAQKQREFTKETLKESRGAVKSVRSYAKLLSCRPTAGNLERDMISGIELQGEKMSDMVKRLESAFNVDPEPLSITSSTSFAPNPHQLTQSCLEN